jgi:hypothetical protein
MEFLSPYILWGLAGLSAPIFIHLWNQRKTKLIPWAATRFLVSHNKSVAKGLRLDDILLLILRLLLIGILSFLLAEPFLKFNKNILNKPEALFIADTPQIREEFKFEINKNQNAIWIKQKLSLSDIQSAINQNQAFFHDNQVTCLLPFESFQNSKSPLIFPSKTNALVSSNFKKSIKAILQSDWIYIDKSDNLVNSKTKPADEVEVVHKGVVFTELKGFNQDQKVLVTKALKSIEDIYKIKFEVADVSMQKHLIISLKPSNLTEVFWKNNQKKESINVQFDDLVFNGSLPEYLLTSILKVAGLYSFEGPLNPDLIQKRILTKYDIENESTFFLEKKLLIFFLVILIVERFISLKKKK